jgi:hypothetical protein
MAAVTWSTGEHRSPAAGHPARPRGQVRRRAGVDAWIGDDVEAHVGAGGDLRQLLQRWRLVDRPAQHQDQVAIGPRRGGEALGGVEHETMQRNHVRSPGGDPGDAGDARAPVRGRRGLHPARRRERDGRPVPDVADELHRGSLRRLDDVGGDVRPVVDDEADDRLDRIDRRHGLDRCTIELDPRRLDVGGRELPGHDEVDEHRGKRRRVDDVGFQRLAGWLGSERG